MAYVHGEAYDNSAPVIKVDPQGRQIVSMETSAGATAFDVFGRLRVSEPTSLLEIVHYDEGVAAKFAGKTADSTGTITHLPAESAMQLTCAAGQKLKYQSHQYVPYQPGKSRETKITGVFDTHVAGCVYRFGYLDDDDGPCAGRDDTGLFVELRTSTISGVAEIANELVKYQGSWNIDNFDGKGPSGVNITEARAAGPIHVYIDLQWLAVGIVKVGFDIGGTPHVAHVFDFTNNEYIRKAYMRRGALPVRWEIDNTAGGATVNAKAICATVLSNGGHELSGLTWGADTGVTARSVSGTAGTQIPLLSIRPAALFESRTNHGIVLPQSFDVISDQDVLIEVYLAATLTTAANWTVVDSTSRTEFDREATAFTGGRKIGGTFIAGGQGNRSTLLSKILGRDLLLYLQADGTPLSLHLIGTRLAADATVRATIDWLEPQ